MAANPNSITAKSQPHSLPGDRILAESDQIEPLQVARDTTDPVKIVAVKIDSVKIDSAKSNSGKFKVPLEADRIDSWKSIAAFFGKDERTVKRWEKERGLPVHRIPGSRGTVFAFSGELESWLRSGSEPGSTDQTDQDVGTPVRDGMTESPVQAAAAAEQSPEQPALFSDPSDAPHASTQPAYASPRRHKERGVWMKLIWAFPAVLIALLLLLSFGGRDLFSKQAVASTHLPDAATQDLYLKGRYHFEKRTPDDLNQAVDLFTQAIVRDPQYAQAYVGLADSYHLLREYSVMSTGQAEQRAWAAAKKATELDPNSAAAHTSLAFASFWGNLDASAAETEFRRALKIDPNFTRAHHWYATFLLATGKLKEALAQIEQAQQLDPSSKAILADKGCILASSGRREEARTLLSQMEASDPDFPSPHAYLEQLDEAEGNYSAMLRERRTVAALKRDPALQSELAGAEAAFKKGGEQGLKLYELESAKKAFDHGEGSAYAVAVAYASMNDHDRTLSYLELARQRREADLAKLTGDGSLIFLHTDPAFRTLAASLHLPIAP